MNDPHDADLSTAQSCGQTRPMKTKYFKSYTSLDITHLQEILAADPKHPHIHQVDMQFRLASTWQDFGCELATWEDDDQLLGWAVFQPAWWNLDVAIHPVRRTPELETEIMIWGVEQMQRYSKRTKERFWGSVEFFKCAPYAKQSDQLLTALGFEKFEWSTIRLELDLSSWQKPSNERLPAGFSIRPLAGSAEVEAYTTLHRAAFGSNKMTAAWRARTLKHPPYMPELDLVVVDTGDRPVGFSICWLWQGSGQIEPLGIHPDFQGLGLGTVLELAAIEVLQQHGAHSVLIDHTSFNKAAITLSQKNGFRKSKNALRYYVDIKPD